MPRGAVNAPDLPDFLTAAWGALRRTPLFGITLTLAAVLARRLWIAAGHTALPPAGVRGDHARGRVPRPHG